MAKRKDFDTIWVHPLVHSWSRERLDESKRRRKALHAISLVAAFVSYDPGARRVENWVKERTFLPHIQKSAHHICRDGSLGDIETGASQRSGFRTLVHMLNYHGEFSLAGELYQWILAREETPLDKDNRGTLSAVYGMATAFWKQGKYNEALEWYRRALAGDEKSLGKNHPDTLSTISSIANVFLDQGKYDEALEWYRRALAGREKSLGKGHPDTLFAVYGIASVFRRQGKYDEALEWYRRALAGRGKSLGKDHPDTLSAVGGIAGVFQRQRKHDEALEWYRRALAGREKSLGKGHPDTLSAVNGMANVFLHQGKYDEALEWYKRALAGGRNPWARATQIRFLLSMGWQTCSWTRESSTRHWSGTGEHSPGERSP